MEEQVKKKLCWNCEARVDFGIETCPSCGVYLSTSPILEQSSTNSYIAPPYRLVSNEQEEVIPESPYSIDIGQKHEEEKVEVHAPEVHSVKETWKSEMVPMSCLLTGAAFSLFSLVLILFSEGGTLTLKWNGDYWYFYLALGLPLLFVGWRSLRELPDQA